LLEARHFDNRHTKMKYHQPSKMRWLLLFFLPLSILLLWTELGFIWTGVDGKKGVSQGYTRNDVSGSLRLNEQAPLFNPLESNKWKHDLFRRLDRIRQRCGKLCEINNNETIERYTVSGGQSFRRLKVPVDCKQIMLDEDIDVADGTVPFPPPPELIPYYTMGGLVRFKLEHKYSQLYLGGEARTPVWNISVVNKYYEQMSRNRKMNYGSSGLLLKSYLAANLDVNGKTVLVIGSEYPWVEAICLHLGATQVTTLEYGEIISEHPQIKTLKPGEVRLQYQNSTNEYYDLVVSFSSLEHSGLGRYGDSLNPWGDILAVARARCLTKPGGHLVIAVPYSGKRDSVIFNAHRIYSQWRYPLLTANWEQIDGDHHKTTEKYFQPIFIFQNPP